MTVKPSVEGVRFLRSQNQTYEQIAEHYGMTPGEVYAMLRSGAVDGEGEG